MKKTTTFCLRFILFLFLFGLFSPRIRAQDSILCFQVFFPVVEAQAGETVCVPLMVRDFELIATMQFGVHWDSTAMSLVGVDIQQSNLPNVSVQNFNANLKGRFYFVWESLTLMGVTLPDSTTIVNLCFKIEPGVSGFIPLNIGDLQPYSIFEVVQMLPPDWRAVVMPNNQQLGGISVGAGSPSSLAITSTCSRQAKCGNYSGTAAVEVAGGQPPYTYQWSGPVGFSAQTAEVDNLLGGAYKVTVTDQTGATVVAQFKIASNASGIWTSKQLTAAHCDAADGCATLTVNGGQPPYIFDWPVPGGVGNKHCALPTGFHQVSITDARGCTALSEFTIGNQSNFYVNLDIQHIENCDSTGAITALPSGTGTGPYQYLWSTGDTTQTITGLAQGNYWVSVTSGSCRLVKYAQVLQTHTYQWGLYATGVCSPTEPNIATLQLFTWQSNFNKFPLYASWSDGTTHEITEPVQGSLLDELTDMPSGSYSVHVTDSSGCGVVLPLWVDCAQMPPVPDDLTAFYIKDEYLNPQYKIDSCVGVYARNFEDITTMSFSLTCTDAKEIRLQKLGVPGLDYSDFEIQQSLSRIGVNWHSPEPVTLPQESLLFEVCFKKSTSGNPYVPILFDNLVEPVSLIGIENREKAFIGKDGYVMFDLYFPLQPSVCEFGVMPPDCSSDGKSQIILGQCNSNLDASFTLSSLDNTINYGKTSSLLTASAGEYRAKATQTTSRYESFFVKIPEVKDSSFCVWPGDADDNNAVNHYDLLYLGMAYGSQGPARSNPSINWDGQDAVSWTEATQTRGINFKNIDTNGDGMVNADDTLAIVQNWGRVINPLYDYPFGAPGLVAGAPNHPLLTIHADTLRAGQAFRLPVVLGTAFAPVDSMYGLAFSVSYDPRFVKDNLRFIPADSWLGDTSDLLCLQKNFPEHGHVDIALTRTNGIPVSGSGVIGTMYVIIEDNIFAGINPLQPNDTTAETKLYLKGLNTVNAKEKLKMLDAPPVGLVVQRELSSGAAGPVWEREIQLYPNPAATRLYISSPDARIEQILLTDASGRRVSDRSFDDFSAQIGVESLPQGFYFAKIFTEKGYTSRKICISR